MINADGLPDQGRVWDAYGHAMAAAQGLELVLRIANFTKKANAIIAAPGSPKNFEGRTTALKDGATNGTFGQVVANFIELHQNQMTDEIKGSLEIAVGTRNFLAHHFLVGHVANLTSEAGLDLMAVECTLARDFLTRLDDLVRATVQIDIGLFLESAVAAQAGYPAHPLADLLAPEADAKKAG